jgi:hypothetical protein
VSRAVTIVRELVKDGRSSTLALFGRDPAGDARKLAGLTAVLVHKLAATRS